MSDDYPYPGLMAVLDKHYGPPPPTPPYPRPLTPGHMGAPDADTCFALGEQLGAALVLDEAVRIHNLVEKLPVPPRALLVWWAEENARRRQP